MWKFYPKSPRRFVIEVFSLKQGEIDRIYVNEKDLPRVYQETIDRFEDDYEELRINLNVYEILTEDWEER